ncbi:Imm40 family immunity protein [Clostridium sp. Marseille-Q2269]|uniref:Imm40 family immunity protein n=1 Tax=Clostridium sp. Marseille-Q2269 TaxID=2942205 RepID=UPI002073088F|nr:Imm40 family immunity protein [Clostridium sp. Marseille-Q2269]
MTDYYIRFLNDFPRELIEVGYSLKIIGINEIAWKEKDAMKVVDFLISKGYAILGGDVYSINGDGFESTYDSWYINKSTNQSFLEESRKKAFEYISEYAERNGGNYLYSIVSEIV